MTETEKEIMRKKTEVPIVVAALQMCSGHDVDKNLNTAIRLLHHAKELGAEMAGLPENFSYMGREEDKISIAEKIEGPTISAIRDTARKLEMTVLAGTIPEICEDDPAKTGNTSVLIDKNGDIAAIYRKIHLFNVNLEEAQGFRESMHIMPGDKIVTGKTLGITHGLSVCYDLRFPELYRKLDMMGAEIFWIPSAFTLATGKDHWEILIRSRAVENGAYISAPAQFGVHSPRRITYGNALIADPWGKVIARAPDRADTMAVAEISMEYREHVRKMLPTWNHHVL